MSRTGFVLMEYLFNFMISLLCPRNWSLRLWCFKVFSSQFTCSSLPYTFSTLQARTYNASPWTHTHTENQHTRAETGKILKISHCKTDKILKISHCKTARSHRIPARFARTVRISARFARTVRADLAVWPPLQPWDHIMSQYIPSHRNTLHHIMAHPLTIIHHIALHLLQKG